MFIGLKLFHIPLRRLSMNFGQISMMNVDHNVTARLIFSRILKEQPRYWSRKGTLSSPHIIWLGIAQEILLRAYSAGLSASIMGGTVLQTAIRILWDGMKGGMLCCKFYTMLAFLRWPMKVEGLGFGGTLWQIWQSVAQWKRSTIYTA